MQNRDFFRVVLPWDFRNSPNKSGHHSRKGRITKEMRTLARELAEDQIGYRNWVDGDRLFSIWVFSEPDNRKRDTGNIRAGMKAYQDGIFDALKMDDFAIKDEHLHRTAPTPGGYVELSIYEDIQAFLDEVMVLTMEAYRD